MRSQKSAAVHLELLIGATAISCDRETFTVLCIYSEHLTELETEWPPVQLINSPNFHAILHSGWHTAGCLPVVTWEPYHVTSRLSRPFLKLNHLKSTKCCLLEPRCR